MRLPNRTITLLLNLAHALDYLFLLIFATAVAAIAHDFGFARWEDLMAYSMGAFVMFGLGSLPAGKLDDTWGRRPMMLVLFFGLGASALLASLTQTVWQPAAALTLMGSFTAIHHPVGIPMLVPAELEPPSRRSRPAAVRLSHRQLTRVRLVMTVTSATAGLLFNLSTNGNGQWLAQRLGGRVPDPATLGLLLAAVSAVASLAQVVVGRLLDRVLLKRLQLCIVLAQAPLLVLASQAQVAAGDGRYLGVYRAGLVGLAR